MDQSQGGKKMNDVPFFPIEIIFQILLCLPGEFLYECGRFVCKEWASIICNPSFIQAHVVKSKGGLLFQNSAQPYQANFLNLENWKTTQLRLPFEGGPLASCRGICLFLCHSGELASDDGHIRRHFRFQSSIPCRRFLYVVNPVTRQFQVLPSLGLGFYEFLHIVYIEQLGQFKVVCHFIRSRSCWFVFTLGIDLSWRKIDVTDPDLVPQIRGTSTAVGQYVFWPRREGNILAINLYDESFRFIESPCGSSFPLYDLQKLGDKLSCILYSKGELLMWTLSDLEALEWVQVSNIEEVVARRKTDEGFHPLGIQWRPDPSIFARCAGTGTDDVFYVNQRSWPCVIHSNSLVKW